MGKRWIHAFPKYTYMKVNSTCKVGIWTCPTNFTFSTISTSKIISLFKNSHKKTSAENLFFLFILFSFNIFPSINDFKTFPYITPISFINWCSSIIYFFPFRCCRGHHFCCEVWTFFNKSLLVPLSCKQYLAESCRSG